MLQLLILHLIQKKLGVKKFELFRYINQPDDGIWYYIGHSRIIKVYPDPEDMESTREAHSNVSLNWLLDDRCKIIKKEV